MFLVLLSLDIAILNEIYAIYDN